jgi:hypothetical protein
MRRIVSVGMARTVVPSNMTMAGSDSMRSLRRISETKLRSASDDASYLATWTEGLAPVAHAQMWIVDRYICARDREPRGAGYEFYLKMGCLRLSRREWRSLPTST